MARLAHLPVCSWFPAEEAPATPNFPLYVSLATEPNSGVHPVACVYRSQGHEGRATRSSLPDGGTVASRPCWPPLSPLCTLLPSHTSVGPWPRGDSTGPSRLPRSPCENPVSPLPGWHGLIFIPVHAERSSQNPQKPARLEDSPTALRATALRGLT